MTELVASASSGDGCSDAIQFNSLIRGPMAKVVAVFSIDVRFGEPLDFGRLASLGEGFSI